MPVDRPWAELLVNADDDMIPFISVMAGIESLHRMTKEDRDLRGVIVQGSDHLTAYNLYADAYRLHGSIGEVYGLPRHLFDDEGIAEWAERRGVLVKSIEDAALAMASIYRSLGLALPTSMPLAGAALLRRFQDLLARFMPFDLVIDEETVDGQEARVSKTSVAGSWGAIAGTLRYFADRFGVPRASIEGTSVPMDLIRRYATHGEGELRYDADRRKAPLTVHRRTEYFGFELEHEIEVVEEPWDHEMVPRARRALAEALARGEARHPAVRRNREPIERLREVYRRSAGATPKLGLSELADLYESRLGDVRSVDDLQHTDLRLDLDALVPREEQERWLALPGAVVIRDREIPVEYDVEELPDGTRQGVARLRLTEKIARTLVDEELPTLDRPLRFVVPRGQRGAARGTTLAEVQDALDEPWTAEEIARLERERERERSTRRNGKGRREQRGGPRHEERGRGPRGERGDRGDREGRGGRGRDPEVNPRRRRGR
ncbi:MAG TPA: DEAD/DEAH box helicase, partial [Gemmatimonadaceae bacterium]|nr:DEAD/DEAH box helicase [Gemmatimonadaceae bacterium]